jgi:putative ABC transport system ATP-binding protein
VAQRAKASAEKTQDALTGQGLGRRIGERWVWRHLDLELPAASILGLSGPSGAGKTLLLRALAGLDPLDEGEVKVQGAPLDEGELPRHRARVAYLAQRPALFPGTVEDNLRVPFELAVHAGRRFERARILEQLQPFGRDEAFLHRPANRLSGGEAQITALIRILQLDPVVLLLDEPSAALDEESTSLIEALVRRFIRGDMSRACIWTSHDGDQLDRMADRRLTLESKA